MTSAYSVTILLLILCAHLSLLASADVFRDVKIEGFFPTRISKLANTADLIATGSKQNTKDSDAILARVRPDGSQVWLTNVGEGGDQVAYKILIDSAADEYYIIGTTDSAFDGEKRWRDDGSRLFVVKFDSKGQKKWTRIFGLSNSVFLDATFDSRHKRVLISTMDMQVCIIHLFESNGDKVFSKQFISGAVARALHYDNVHDEIIAAGFSFVQMTSARIDKNGEGFVGQMSSTGDITRVVYLGNSFAATSVTCDDTCSVIYAAGAELVNEGSDQEDIDCQIQAVKLDGTKLWSKKWGSKAADAIFHIEYSHPYKAVVVAGASLGGLDENPNQGQEDAYLAAFNLDGQRKYVRYFGTENIDAISSISVDPSDGAVFFLLHHLKNYDTPLDAYMISIKDYMPEKPLVIRPTASTPSLPPSTSPSSKPPSSSNQSSDQSGTSSPPSSESREGSGASAFFLTVFIIGIMGAAGYFAYLRYGDLLRRRRYVQLSASELAAISPDAEFIV